MKTLVNILMVGALSAMGAFAGAVGTSPTVANNGNSIATPVLPFRPIQKRPVAARQAPVAAPRVNVGAPGLPFRTYQKRPVSAPSNKASGIEAAKRQ